MSMGMKVKKKQFINFDIREKSSGGRSITKIILFFFDNELYSINADHILAVDIYDDGRF